MLLLAAATAEACADKTSFRRLTLARSAECIPHRIQVFMCAPQVCRKGKSRKLGSVPELFGNLWNLRGELSLVDCDSYCVMVVVRIDRSAQQAATTRHSTQQPEPVRPRCLIGDAALAPFSAPMLKHRPPHVAFVNRLATIARVCAMANPPTRRYNAVSTGRGLFNAAPAGR
jgi:hypothetical protein